MQLYLTDPRRRFAASILEKMIKETGAQRGLVAWQRSGSSLLHPYVASDGVRLRRKLVPSHRRLLGNTDAGGRDWVLLLGGALRAPLGRYEDGLAYTLFFVVGFTKPAPHIEPSQDADPATVLIDLVGQWVDYGWCPPEPWGAQSARRISAQAARTRDPILAEASLQVANALQQGVVGSVAAPLLRLGRAFLRSGAMPWSVVAARLAYEAAIAGGPLSQAAEAADTVADALAGQGEAWKARQWSEQATELRGGTGTLLINRHSGGRVHGHLRLFPSQQTHPAPSRYANAQGM